MLTNNQLKEITKDGLKKVINQRIIYKYVDFATGLKRIITEQTLKFTSPVDLNDPYDCNENLLDIKVNKDWITKFANSQRSKHLPKVIQEVLKKVNDPNVYREVLKKEKTRFKISCFSQNYNEVLMWSHYANKHCGICIGFDVEFMGDGYALYPVTYVKEISKIDGLTDTSRVFYYWLTNKHSKWEYESEMRLIVKDAPDIIPFEQNVIKEVIFGERVPEIKLGRQYLT